MWTKTGGSAGCSEAWSCRRGSGVQAFCRRQNLEPGGLCLPGWIQCGAPAGQVPWGGPCRACRRPRRRRRSTWTKTGGSAGCSEAGARGKPPAPASACRKHFFDKLPAFFKTPKSSEKRLISMAQDTPPGFISALRAALRRLCSETPLRGQPRTPFLPVFPDPRAY